MHYNGYVVTLNTNRFKIMIDGYTSTTIVKPFTSLSLLLKVTEYLHNVLSPCVFNSSR